MSTRWASDVRKLRQLYRLALSAHSILWGLIYAFGPERLRSAPTLVWVDNLFFGLVPVRAWGVVAIVLGVLFLTRHRAIGHGVAHVFWASWSMCLLAATFTVPHGAAGGGWLHVAWVAASHLMYVNYDREDVATLDFRQWKR